MKPTPHTQILELLATARAVALTAHEQDIANGIADQIDAVRWDAEQAGVEIVSPALIRDMKQKQASRLMLRHGARKVAA